MVFAHASCFRLLGAGITLSSHVLMAAGFGAAKHLSQQGYAVTLLDASPNPGGLSSGWRTPQGRAVEAGECL